jgi:hypothetical protein
MPTLWTFGDSFTRGHGMNGEIPEYENADKNATWVNLLANRLGYDVKNFGENGLPNEMIIQNVINNLINFEKDDVIIIESSTMGRMVVPEKDSKYNNANLNPIFIHQNTILDEPDVYLKHFDRYELDSIISFFNNFILDGFYYTNEVKAMIQLSKYLNDKGIVRKVIFWNLFPIKGNKNLPIKEIYENESELQSIYLTNPNGSDTYTYGWLSYFTSQKMTIWDDTYGKINDKHLSKKGHDIFFRLLLNTLGLETKHNYFI